MITNRLCYLAAGLICSTWLLAPASGQITRERNNRNNLSINSQGNAERCADLKVTSTGEIAQSAETFTMTRAEAPVLEMTGVDRGVLRVRGWDRAEYSVEACKVAVGENRGAADLALRGIAVTRTAGHFSMSGPSSDDANWQVYFFINAPRDGSVDLETKNGPISVSGMSGTVKVRATNGPVSISESLGMVEVHTTNGPISFNGGGGEVHLTAKNGPISLNLAGDVWNGPRLEAHTDNGPVSINVPDTFRSGVRLETSSHSPISCKAGACQNAFTDASSNQRIIQLNGAQDTIRVSTNNGPVSVNNGSNKIKKII
jgi:hypothetical protein